MNRRAFVRSIGGAVAATLIPFCRPIRLSAPKKPKPMTYYVMTHRRSSYYSPAYLKALQEIVGAEQKSS